MPAPFDAYYVSGTPHMLPHVFGADTPAGAVVVVGNQPRIAHAAFTAGQVGALAGGGGVFDCKAHASADIAAGLGVFWDATNKVVTTEATGNKFFGVTCAAIAKSTYGHVSFSPGPFA